MLNEGLIGGFGGGNGVSDMWVQNGVRDWRAGPADERDGDRRVGPSQSGRDGAADEQAQLGREYGADKWGSPRIQNWKLMSNCNKFDLLQKLPSPARKYNVPQVLK
jgi:hypothetical protein